MLVGYINFFFILIIFYFSSYISYIHSRLITYFIFIMCFFAGLHVLIIFNKSLIWYQTIFVLYHIVSLQISYIIGIDGLSIHSLILSIFLLIHRFLIYWHLRYMIKFYSAILFFTLWILIIYLLL